MRRHLFADRCGGSAGTAAPVTVARASLLPVELGPQKSSPGHQQPCIVRPWVSPLLPTTMVCVTIYYDWKCPWCRRDMNIALRFWKESGIHPHRGLPSSAHPVIKRMKLPLL